MQEISLVVKANLKHNKFTVVKQILHFYKNFRISMPLNTELKNSHKKEIRATLKNYNNVRNVVYLKEYFIQKFILMKTFKK